MTDQQRKQLRRANTLTAGLLLQARSASTREEAQAILKEALLTYGLLNID